MFFYNKNHHFNEKRQKFSIRKYKVGTFSVVVGALFYLNGISNMVQATEMSDNLTATSVEEKKLGEVRKDTESKPVEDAQGVNAVVNQSTVEEKKEVAEKRNDSETTAKEEPVVVENSVSIDKTETVASESTLSNVVSNEKEESLKNIKESAETSFLVQELQQVFQKGKSLSNTIHVDFRVDLEEILKEIEENDKTQKNITKELIEQYKERIQNLKNKNDEYQKGLNEKVNKIQALQEEINSISSSIEYALEPEEKALLKVAGEFSILRHTEVEANGFITQLKQLRNKVANRMTRAHSGKRDPRNGKPIDGKGESGFRGITYTHKENRRNGNPIENGNTAVYYNSDEIWSLIEIKGERVGNERKFTTYARGKVVEDVTPYYIVTVGFTENSPIKGLKTQVAYWDKKAGVQRVREIKYGKTEINNPITNAAIRGVVGQGGIVQPGRYEVHIASNTRVAPNQLRPYTFTFIIKPQSERNTVKDLSQTYVDDVRHLTETEKTALIEKFKTEHPDIMKPSEHKSDFERAEISADGTTMTIHFKDGFNPKTIQTNATNDVEAKHSSLTAYFGDSKELYTNPRELVRSKTGHEVPATAQVTYKTPFNLQQAGTRNVVVTTTYQNGVTKDVTTPYTVLDFIGKQDKKINQNQSGELGDARNYVTVSDNSAVPSELTVRWKGGSTVDTSTAGFQHKEIEILRGNHLMKTVNIPVEIIDNIKPTITAPDNITLTRLEGLPSEINIQAKDNDRGVGLKDGNAVTVENLSAPLMYNAAKSKIEINGVIPNNFQLGKSSIQVTVKAVDKKGNTATKNITFHIQSQTQKYTAVANPQKQEVSYGETPDAGISIQKNGLPTGTRYGWATAPNTTTGPGDKVGVVTVTYPDGSTDTVNVTVKVRKLSDEHIPTGKTITVNQNDSVTNDRLKAAVTVNNGGTSKVKSVTASPISAVHAGTQTIRATVTYLDNTTDLVDIPLEVKDVTAPTIQTPSDRQNWNLIALDRTLPSIRVSSVDNNGGTGVKSTTVTGLPDFLVYDDATKTIKFKNGVQEVTKLPIGQDSKIYNANIQVTDNANNSSQRPVTITVKSMTTKYTATANSQKQTVSYGVTPDAGTSVNKNGLPTGTAYTWATTPSTTTGPGDKSGVVTVTYPDGSKDTVNVTVAVRKLSDEHEPTGSKIVKNQNDIVLNEDLKSAVTISNNENSKIKSVTSVGTISTAEFGNKTINATVTYLDDTTDTVTIPLEVNDKTAPTITMPTEGQLWEVTSLDKTFPSIKIAVSDNPGGSGIKSIVPINLPSFLKYDKATSSIVFQDGEREVPKLSGINRTTRNITLHVEDNAGNSSERTFRIIHMTMAEKYNPQANATIQEVSHGETPNSKTSVNTTGLPTGAQYSWKSTPDTSKPGTKTGVVKVTYPDDSVDEVTVTVKVRKLSDEYEPTATKIVKNQNDTISDQDLKSAVTINKNGNSKVKTVTTVGTISTVETGNKEITATVTYLDETTDTVTIPLEVKDVTAPTIQSPTHGQNIDLIALDREFSPIKVTSEDNAGGSGVQSTTVTDLPDFLTYDDATKTIKFKEGTQEVPKLPVGTDSQTHTATIRVIDNANNSSTSQLTFTVKSMTTKYDATANPDKQTVSYGVTPDAGTSVNKTGLPEGTSYAWKTTPVTTDGPGEKDGVVEVMYKDGSKDIVNVKVTVKELSSEYEVSGAQIEVNQNDPVTNDDLKAKVTATSKEGNVNGTDKISSVEPKTPINTANYGDQSVSATVTFKDGTTKEVTIPLKVKDVTKPTISAPAENTNWEVTALDKALPNMEVRAEDNEHGSGIKNVTVTGLPDYLEYDSATHTIKFQSGKDAVEKLAENTSSQEFTLNIRAEDKAGNVSERTAKITVSSISAKKDPTLIPQNTSYGKVPDPNASVDKAGLPDGTTVTWKTPPTVTVPGTTTGVVEVTYPDGSKDTVEVTVNVSKLSDEYNVSGDEIVVNQNDSVTNDDLKAKVTATLKEGNVNGTDKISTVTAPTISTANYGAQTITATVTFKDGTTKPVTIPLKVKDVTPPTIQTPTNGQNWDLIALEGENPNIAVTSEDNTGGSGVKSTTVMGLPNFLEYNESTKKIQFKAGMTSVPSLPEGTDVQPHNITIEVEDNAGNKISAQVTITVKSMTTKYDATPNSEKQTVSYGVTPDAATSVNTSGLPEGTKYKWTTTPDTNTPGEKDGVVEVTYKDGSKDTVNVKVNVNKLSDEYDVIATEIEVNQNTPVTNDDLKAKVTATSKVGNVSGTDKISTVTASPIDTSVYGNQNISAVVTFKDGTTKEVTIPLKVKDITKPTISVSNNGQNWDLIAVEGPNPEISVTSEDNAGGSGVKTTTVTGLPDFIEYNESTKKIQFKAGVTTVPSLSEGINEQPHHVTITVIDNAGNETTTNVTITVKSMTSKYDATPNLQKQTVSYGVTPDAGTSVNKTGLPEGTSYAWKTTPDTNTPGEKDGVVEVTYKDGSKDTVNVKVTVKELSSEYDVTGSLIEVNQNTPVTNDDLKAKVTATLKDGNVNGTDKISTVTAPEISTANYGEQTINATVTFKDGTTKDVTIPLKVKDITKPTISAPTNGQNWDLIAVEGQNPNIAVTSEDNTGGSGVKSTTVTGLPDFLAYDEATKTIKFKTGVTQVPSLPEGTDVQLHNITIEVEDNAGNKTSTPVTITVKSMTTKYDATPNSEKQTVSYGKTPDAGTSVDKTNLPEGTSYAWKTTPDTNTPGEKDGVVEVTYKDGSKDTVNVKVNVNKLSDEYNVTATEIEVNQNTPVTNDDLKAKVTATSKVGNVSGTDKISTVTASPIDTSVYGNQNISAVVTFKDGTTKDVTIPLKVKDVTAPTITAPKENTNWEMTALDKTLPNMEVSLEDNANGSGIKNVTVTGLPDYLEYDSVTNVIKFKAGKQTVEKLPENIPNKEFTLNIRVEDNAGNFSERSAKITVSSMSAKNTPTAKQPNQTAKHGSEPSAEGSINTDGLPSGTTYTWVEKPDTNTTPGSKPGKVLITYPDKSTEEVTVTIEVTPQKDDYDPQPTTPNQEVSYKGTPSAETSVNKNGLPANTTYSWESPVDTDIPGEKTGVVIVHYPDGTEDKVKVTIKVKDTDEKGVPEVQPEVPEFNGGVKGDPEVQPEVPEFNGGVNGESEVQPEVPEFNGGVNGDPEVQPEVPEFNGGVNGELPASVVESPKDKLIITKWIDEQDNQLKPADAKAPAVLGEANEALEAGEIEGYVFVRTETKGDVVTHIFRKVTPDKSENNGEQQGGNNKSQPILEAPTDYTDCKPEAINPSEQPTETEKTTMKPNTSQNILPNTGTSDGFGIFFTAVASILAGLGFILPVKKKDEE